MRTEHAESTIAELVVEHRFTMPAEHWKHSKTLTAWPDRSCYPERRELEGLEHDIAAISNSIAEFEPVTLFVKKRNIDRARRLISAKVEIEELDVNEPWIRDTGPVYVKTSDNTVIGVDFNFNCWGDKYDTVVDSKVAASILKGQGVAREQAPIVAEGGAIEVDGEGTLLITESSIWNKNRNPNLGKGELEKHLKDLLGVQKIIWFAGIRGRDITDAHIDGLVRFIAPGKVLLSRPSPGSEQYLFDVYQNAKNILAKSTDAMGRKLQVSEIEEADMFAGTDPYEQCCTYINYLLVNDGVIIPAFGDPAADKKALAVMTTAFPDRKISQVLLSTLWKHGGGIHCTTQQQPL